MSDFTNELNINDECIDDKRYNSALDDVDEEEIMEDAEQLVEHLTEEEDDDCCGRDGADSDAVQLSYDELVWCFENNVDVFEYMSAIEDNKTEMEVLQRKSSQDKTQEEKIKSSRTFKVFHAQHNSGDIDYSKQDNTIKIDEDFQEKNTSFSGTEIEEEFHELIKNSKYANLLDPESYFTKLCVKQDLFVELFDFIVARMYPNYPIVHLLVLMCDYFNVRYETAYKFIPMIYVDLLKKELTEYRAKSSLTAIDDETSQVIEPYGFKF